MGPPGETHAKPGVLVCARVSLVTNTDPVLLELDGEIARLQEEIAKIREMRAWWKSRRAPTPSTASPRLTADGKDKAPTAKDWIRRVLGGGARLKPAEIARAAIDLGWATSSKSPNIIVRNQLREMETEVDRTDDGRYYLRRHLFPVDQESSDQEVASK